MDYNEFWEMQRCLVCMKNEMDQLKAPFAAEHNITGGQLCLLLALQQQSGQTVSALSQTLRMADANVSTQVKRLRERGLVQRRRHPDDERQVCISLTQEGQQLMGQFNVYAASRLQAAMSTASKEEREDIQKGLSALERVFNQ